MELLRQERYAQALEILQALPPELEADADAQLLCAALFTNTGKLAEAEAICRNLLARDELNAGAHYLMALCREHCGDERGTLDHDRMAIYLDASFAMPHLHLGLHAKRKGDWGLAEAELEHAANSVKPRRYRTRAAVWRRVQPRGLDCVCARLNGRA